MGYKNLWVGFAVLLFLAPWTLWAQQQNVDPAPIMKKGKTSAQNEAADQALPSMEFLEFLGDWETEDGQWIDPADWELALPEQETNDENNESKKN